MSARIKSYTDCKTIADGARKDDATRSQGRGKVEGQLAGNLPYDPDKLKKNGQGYRANVNFRELEGSVKMKLGSFFRLIFDSMRLVTIKLNDRAIPFNYRRRYEDIIAQEFHKMLKDRFSFYFEIAKAMRSMVVHGPGTLYWPTEKEFLPKAAKPGKVCFSKNTEENPDEYDTFCITDEISWDKLWSLIENKTQKNVSETRGWRTKFIFEILKAFEAKDSSDNLSRMPETDEEYELIAAKKDTYKIAEGKPQSLEITYVYSKEKSGKFTKAIILRDEIFEEELKDYAYNIKTEDDKYLYYSKEEFEDVDDIVVVLLNDIGHDGLHAIRGYAHKIYPHAVVSNRMMNTGLDGAMLQSTMIVQSPTSGSKPVADVIRLGPITAIDSDQKVVTGTLNTNLQGVISMRQILNTNMNNNFGSSKIATEGNIKGADYKTARQTQYEQVVSNNLSNVEVMTFYMFVDRVFGTMNRKIKDNKLAGEAKKCISDFVDVCVQRGVPKEIMDKMDWKMCAFRAIGSGSRAEGMMLTRDMLAITPQLPEEGKRNVIRDYIVVRGGADALERYFPELSEDDVETVSHHMAKIENAILKRGDFIPPSPEDDHPYHLTAHMDATMQDVKVFMDQQHMSAVEMEQYLANAIQHMSQHIAFLQGALNEKIVDEAMDVLKQLKVFHKKMQNAARKEVAQQEEQAKQQQGLIDKAIKKLEGDDIALKLEQMKNEHELKMYSASEDLRIRELKTQARIMQDQEVSDAKVRQIRNETLAKMREYKI